MDENQGFLDLGLEDLDEKKTIHARKLDKARAQNITPDSLENFDTLLWQFEDFIKLTLDAGEPADIEPL